MNLSLAVFTFTSMWLTVYGDKSTKPHEMDAKAAMAKTAGSPGLSAVHTNDLQKGSSLGLRKSRKDRGLLFTDDIIVCWGGGQHCGASCDGCCNGYHWNWWTWDYHCN